MKRSFIVAGLVTSFMLLGVGSIQAHVTVRPKEALIAAFQTFTIGVPNEKEIPTTGMRLVMPEGLNHVSPNVKPGWKIEIKKTGEGEEAKVTEVIWSGGSVPAGQRDEFLFSAQVPASPTTLQWKAYQTYSDGTVVAWDQESGEMIHDEKTNKESGPFSTTTVLSDIEPVADVVETTEGSSSWTNMISLAAIGLAGLSLVLHFKDEPKA